MLLEVAVECGYVFVSVECGLACVYKCYLFKRTCVFTVTEDVDCLAAALGDVDQLRELSDDDAS